jgi:serine/threonine protein kinase
VHDLAPGSLLHQRYRIVRLLGKGGMGAVYEAVDVRLHNTVAVKQMTIDVPEATRAFEREARLLAALRYPALPVVIDCFSEAGGQFLVMQYIEGEDLAHALDRRGRPFDNDELVHCAIAVAGALAYLHRHDPPIVHRDLKPHNVKRTPAGEYVLLDFGLATGRRHSDSTIATGARSIYGYTPQYSPPEQIDGLSTDGRSDIFALGATLFHLAAGMPPPIARERLRAIESGKGDPLADRLRTAPGLDVQVQAVIARALALDPDDRFQSASEILSALGGSEAATRPAPAPDLSAEQRRVDAALPSQAEVGRALDLIVQVRFATSPLLGIEAWPSRRKPDRIEQASEALAIVYPTDPDSGERLPARLRIRIVAPDFGVAGTSEQLLDVPPRDYSKRLAFLLTPLHPGFCRVNVEVYALDAAFLGVIAIEAEAFGEGVVAAAGLRVANLDLRLVVQHAPGDQHRIGPYEIIAPIALGGMGGVYLARDLRGDADAAGQTPIGSRPVPSFEANMDAASTLPLNRDQPSDVPGPALVSASSGESSTFRRQLIAAAAALVVLTAAGITMLRPQLATSPKSDVTGESKSPPGSVDQSAASVPPSPLVPPGLGPSAGATGGATGAAGAGTAIAPSSGRGSRSGAAAGGTPNPVAIPTAQAPPAPTVVPMPPAGQVPPPIGDEDYAKNAVKAALNDLCRGYEELSPEAVQQVFPTVNIASLRLALDKSQFKSVSCTFAEPTFQALDPVAGTAKIRVEVKHVFEHVGVSSTPDVRDLIADMTLSRASQRGRWFVERAEYRPKR